MTGVNRITSKLVNGVVNLPLIIRHTAYAAFDAWPHADPLPSTWQGIPVYCVSMRSSVRRRSILDRQVESLGFSSFEYVDAPDLARSTLSMLEAQGLYDDAEAVHYHGTSLRLAQISCSLAHGMAYERIVDVHHACAMIIEDDALFVSRRFRLLEPAELPSDYDVVLLNSFRNTDRPTDRVSPHLFGSDSYSGSTCAYLVSATGAAKLASSYKPVIHAADGLLGRCMEWPEDQDHPFKGKGARSSLRSYLMIPDFVLNGSDSYYYKSIHRPAK